MHSGSIDCSSCHPKIVRVEEYMSSLVVEIMKLLKICAIEAGEIYELKASKRKASGLLRIEFLSMIFTSISPS